MLSVVTLMVVVMWVLIARNAIGNIDDRVRRLEAEGGTSDE